MSRPGRIMALAALTVLVGLAAPASGDYEYTAESGACGYPRFYTPSTGDSGALPDDYPVRGPAGALFGRTIGAVRNQLVWWTVPMSGGARVQVHRLLLPVLTEVEANLAEAAADGKYYPVRVSDTYGFNARTSVSHDAVSFHGLGAAIDINAGTNPYRLDGELITDMPAWFVEAWESAGMCWGGHWNHVKDPMHFSWVGPAGSATYQSIPEPIPPLTAATEFTSQVGRHQVVFEDTPNPVFVTEASGDGAPDVAHIRPLADKTVLELATSRGGYAACGIWRWMLDEPAPGTPYMADVTGDGRADLVYLDESDSRVRLRVYRAGDGYQQVDEYATTVDSGLRYTFGDFDAGGADDLWALASDSDSISYEVWSAESRFDQKLSSGTANGVALTTGVRLASADRNADGRDDLLVVEPDGSSSSVSVILSGGAGEVFEKLTGPAIDDSDVLGFEDYDGDGRPDLVLLDEVGTLAAWAGNTVLTGLTPSSWFVADDFECPEDTPPYFFEGRFADDEGSEFESDIEWLAGTGITRGCNPPFEDRFCPDQVVTRGQMAAFLNRALNLSPAESGFVDTGGSVFEQDIAALAASGITRGCNPPDNDRFCPDDPVTRGQMAAFLTRALRLPVELNSFLDDDSSVFEGDIGALAGSGITRGCNPPDNDRFCADDPVTRAQMAAFLHRAAGLLPGSGS